MNFKDFLINEYQLSESSAQDYVGRFNGIVDTGIYKKEDDGDEMTSSLRNAIEKEFPNSKNHYILALERYFDYRKKFR